MTVDSGAYLQPKPERTSVLQVGFEPSKTLDDALHRFLMPNLRRRGIDLRASESLELPYIKGDSSGVVYDSQSRERINRHRQTLRQLGEQSILLTNMHIGRSPRGDVQLHLEAMPTPDQRKLLAGYVLQGLVKRPEQPLVIYTQFSHLSVVPEEELLVEALELRRLIALDNAAMESGGIMPKYYVRRPDIVEHIG